MGKIVAIGGGENGRPGTEYETGAFDRQIIRLTGRERPHFLFIGLANPHSDSYFETMCDIYGGMYDCITDYLTRADITSPQVSHNKIRRADIIYVGGGNTQKLMTLLRRYGIDKLLADAYEEGKVLCGVSAGAICWCSYGNSDSRKFTSGSEQLIRVTGLGLLPILLCPHYDAEPLRRADMPRMMRSTRRVPGIALDNGAALEVLDDQWRILTGLPGAKAYKCYSQGGGYCETPLPLDGTYRPLEELLAKP